MTAFALGCLIYAHIIRMIQSYGIWDLDITTSMMILCIHLCSLAWDYVDGAADPAILSREQKKNAIHKLPTFLEFFASGICPTQCFAGPCSNFADFKNYIYSHGIYASIPSTVTASMKRFLTGWIFVIFYVGIHKFYSTDILKSPDFPKLNFFLKVVLNIENA